MVTGRSGGGPRSGQRQTWARCPRGEDARTRPIRTTVRGSVPSSERVRGPRGERSSDRSPGRRSGIRMVVGEVDGLTACDRPRSLRASRSLFPEVPGVRGPIAGPLPYPAQKCRGARRYDLPQDRSFRDEVGLVVAPSSYPFWVPGISRALGAPVFGGQTVGGQKELGGAARPASRPEGGDTCLRPF